MKIATLLLLLVACRAMQGEEMLPRQILEGPETQVVSSDESSVTFNCRIRGEDVEWTINGRLSDPTENMRLIDNYDVEFYKTRRVNGQINASITFPNIPHFNSTRVICVSLNATGDSHSQEAAMIIAGSPLPPAPRLEVLNATLVRVSWEEPFTWDLFPVLSYQVSVYNVSSGTYTNTYTLSGSQRSQVVTVESCSILILQVSASNSEGMSAPGTITAEIPTGISDSLNPAVQLVKLNLLSDGQPGIAICVKLPVLCVFQRVRYSVVISHGGDPVLELSREFNYSSGYTSECIEEPVSGELEERTEYSVQVFVDAGDTGNSSSTIQTFRPPVTAKTTEPTQPFDTEPFTPSNNYGGRSEGGNNGLSVGLAAGIAVLLSLLVVLPVGVVIGCCGMWCLLKRKEDLPGNIYDVPYLTENTFPLSDNEAYGSANKSRN